MQQRFRSAKAILKLVLLLAAAGQVTAQTEPREHGSVGLSVAVQSTDTAIRVPIWLSQTWVLTPGVAFAHATDLGTDIGAGLAIRRNLQVGRSAPYVGAAASVLSYSPDGGDGTLDFIVGFVVGGESFLNEDFSLGVEAQLNATISDENSLRFGNPDSSTFNTASSLYAAFYF